MAFVGGKGNQALGGVLGKLGPGQLGPRLLGPGSSGRVTHASIHHRLRAKGAYDTQQSRHNEHTHFCREIRNMIFQAGI